MLNTILQRLAASKDTSPEPEDCRRALTVLLVRVARSDRDYADSERMRILAILQTRYAISAEQAETVLSEAESIERDAFDTVQFTRALKEKVPYQDREDLLEALWQVALADDHRDHEEDSFMRLAAKLLGINDRNNALARQRVLGKMSRC